MSFYEIKLPSMGEGITDATVTKWLVNEGDEIEIDTPLVEVATDKVDSEIPSPVAGKVGKILIKEGDIPKVGQVLAMIEVAGKDDAPPAVFILQPEEFVDYAALSTAPKEVSSKSPHLSSRSKSGAFVPPLVRKIALEEGVSQSELDSIGGSGYEGKVTKNDILGYLENRGKGDATQVVTAPASSENVTIIEMDRMRKLTAAHMVQSKQTSAHVTSFIEVDMTPIVKWREQNKGQFERQNGEKLTFTPFFFSAVVDAIKAYPTLNSSVVGDQIHQKKDIHLGMATALPNDNLIVPVIKNADRLNLSGLAFAVNDLARRARAFKLQPNEVQGGTFTITNLGAFDNLAGTPIINQPQVAILAVGSIKKRPVVIEGDMGDTIGIRHIAILSLSYDHRIIDGVLGGSFLKRIAQNLENFSFPEL
jgi:Pyruvate/2-oxoglutarate dehydrogenase complex, dihydrolipoamide acyltransferase (E2) component, and related enzymes